MHAVFSGSYGTRTGTNSYWSTFQFKKNKFKTLTEYLKENDYETYADVINQLVVPKQGFDNYVVHDELNDNLVERHKNLLDEMNNKKLDSKNFFLYLHYSNIHTGIMEKVLKPYDNFSTEYFSNKKKNSEYYDKLFNDADKYLEEIYKHLQKLGLEEDTLLVVISDHGISIGEKIGERAYGVFCYDTTLISTAIFCHPSLNSMIFKNQVRSVDILPTILEILSIPLDKNFESMDGKSLVPLINGNNESRIAFSQSGNPLDSGKPPKEPNVYSVRTDEWKYIRNIHDSTEELYDLLNDPHENSNLFSQKTEKSVEMSNLMDEILNQKTQ